MGNELQTKHHEKLRRLLSKLVYPTLLHRIHVAIRSKVKSVVKRHEHNLIKFTIPIL